ncbi:trehalose operon repressor, repressor of treA,B,C [Mesoplasma entomophilum]|uniref:HTH lacI-type domain-containing protein n=1 Tax=Mesoplasma entomophilum TaxID=2149 RepID=A0A3S5XZJ4_9MOLU|nr:LacI family DNA-binding transcriptional regulator [Mesoplasma entomophilum]ATQ35678.1 hypothetical protein CS528_02810 [Mesoplasma entomophilum]ATZ19647.1 trehalose operon repressor, repressor of treA,B,C [Mesoplasma entomophilum]
MSKNNITYHDIAKAANVGIGTVSRYFNNYNISDNAKNKIDKVIKELNYIPNFAASNIKKQSKDVYLILPYNKDETANMEIVNGVKSFMNEKNINFFVFFSSSESDKYTNDLKYLINRNPLGIVLLLPKNTSEKLINEITNISTTKIIVYNRNIKDIESIKIDDKKMFEELASIINLKYPTKNIAFIGLNKKDITTGKNRIEAFEKKIKNKDFKYYLLDQNSFKVAEEIIEKIIGENNPDIIVSATHTISMSVFSFLMSKKIRDEYITTDIGGMGKSQFLTNADINIFIDYFYIGYQLGNKLLNNKFEMENFFKII